MNDEKAKRKEQLENELMMWYLLRINRIALKQGLIEEEIFQKIAINIYKKYGGTMNPPR